MRIINKLRKRGLAMFMALVMCLSLVQVTAFAEEGTVDGDIIIGEGGIQTGDDIQAGNNNQLEDDTHEHIWDEGVITTPATCTAEGVKTFTCTVEGCGETKAEAISIIDHTPVTDARVEPTETETGLTEGAHCSVCNAVLTAQEVIPATGVVIPAEAQAFLGAVYALYDVPEELMLQAVANAETLYNALTDEQKALEEVAQCKAALDAFRETMTLEETGVITVSDEPALRDAIAKGGTVTLGDNIELQSTLKITSTVTFDLNGKTLSLARGKIGSVVEVTGENNVFTLADSSIGGTITGGNANNKGGGIYVGKGITFNMTGGTIKANTATDGGGVYIDERTTFIMTGGSITENNVTERGSGVGVYVNNNGARFEMSNAEISYNGVQNKAKGLGGGVFIRWRDASDPVAFVMNEGAKIVGNYEDSGGGVFLGGSTMVMNGGVISDNEVRDKGAGIYDNGLLTINGGSITNNRTNPTKDRDGRGGGVVIDGGVLRMHGGEISGNSAFAGGGVSVGDDCTQNQGTQQPSAEGALRFEMTGGKICNNTARDYGGGVNVGCCEAVSGTFIMSGGEISGNKVTATNGKGGGVYMFPGALFQMSETDGDSVIKTNTAALGGGVFADTTCNFTMSGGAIYNNTTQTNGNAAQKDKNGGGVYVGDRATFNLSDGTISVNTAWMGGGVYVTTNGVFNMSGGTIKENTVTTLGDSGTGVAVIGDNATFNMSGGTISDHTTAGSGGGVAVMKKGKFTMSGTALITRNQGENGGGVYVDNSLFTMEAGIISDNTTKDIDGYNGQDKDTTWNPVGGGGVIVWSNGNFTMNGGEITGNHAIGKHGENKQGGSYGGGVEIGGGGTFTYNGGILCNNTAETAGADISAYKDTKLTLGATGEWTLTGCNHRITGWFTDVEDARWSDDNTRTQYEQTGEQTVAESHLVLKAAHGRIFTLSYNANGGNGEPDPIYGKVEDDSAILTVSNTVPTRNGYTFLGWSTMPDGSVNYTGGNSITITADTTLYAVWEYNYVPFVPEFPTPTPIPTPTPVTPTPGGTTITDEETPLAGSVGLNDTDHFAYVIGYDDDTVRPLNNITRAEAATIFFRLMTDEYRQANWSTTNSFTDVNAGDWYNNAVSTCANVGVLKGYDDGTFRPNAPITRAEFASMAAGFMDESITDDGTGDFSDTASHWAAAAIRRAAKAGWVTGTGSKFNPDARITRAEVMTIVNRMLDRTPDEDHMLPEMKKWTDNPESEWYYEAVQEATNEHDYERDELNVETWTELLTVRDWKVLETEWANNGGASAPKADDTAVDQRRVPDGI